jgi:hypothetical protein
MVDYREILRLHSQGNSQNPIEACAHVSHHTVKEVLAAAQSLGISWPLEEQLTMRCCRRPFSRGGICSFPVAEPDYAWIHRELAKPGVNAYAALDRVQRKVQCCRNGPLHEDAVLRHVQEVGQAHEGNHADSSQAWRGMQVDWAGTPSRCMIR